MHNIYVYYKNEDIIFLLDVTKTSKFKANITCVVDKGFKRHKYLIMKYV